MTERNENSEPVQENGLDLSKKSQEKQNYQFNNSENPEEKEPPAINEVYIKVEPTFYDEEDNQPFENNQYEPDIQIKEESDVSSTHSEENVSDEDIEIEVRNTNDPLELNKCQICAQNFDNENLLKTHNNTYICKRSFKNYRCTICDGSFTNKKVIKVHLLTHENEVKYQCVQCDKKYTKQASLNKHLLYHKNKPNKCPQCERSFAHASTVQKHILLRHSGEKNFQCTICGRKFTRKDYLTKHQIIHDGIKQHQCAICGRTFARPEYLKEHMITHTGEGTFECQVCGKKFIRNAHLNTHMLIHNGIKNHECSICTRKFRRNSHLKRHLLIHERKMREEKEANETLIEVDDSLWT